MIVTPVNIRSKPYIIIDISRCNISIKKYRFGKIWKYSESCLQSYNEIKTVVIKYMNKNIKKDHCFFIFFYKKEDENAIRIYIKMWLLLAFSRKFIYSATIY